MRMYTMSSWFKLSKNKYTLSHLRSEFYSMDIVHSWETIIPCILNLDTKYPNTCYFQSYIYVLLNDSKFIKKIILADYTSDQIIHIAIQNFIVEYYAAYKKRKVSVKIDSFFELILRNLSKDLFPDLYTACDTRDLMLELDKLLRQEHSKHSDLENFVYAHNLIDYNEHFMIVKSNEIIKIKESSIFLLLGINNEGQYKSIQKAIHGFPDFESRINKNCILKNVEIIKLPKTLQIYVNQVYYDKALDQNMLGCNRFVIEENISINGFCYELKSAICFSYGDGKTHKMLKNDDVGHYWSYFKRNKKYYCCNYGKTREIEQVEMFRNLCNSGIIIFYELI